MFEDFATAVNGFFGIILDGIKVVGFGAVVVVTVGAILVGSYYAITRVIAPIARIIYDRLKPDKDKQFHVENAPEMPKFA